MIPIVPTRNGRDRGYGRNRRHCGHGRHRGRGRSGGCSPVEVNWRGRRHVGSDQLERRRRRWCWRSWRSRSVLSASQSTEGAESADHGQSKKTNPKARFHRQTLPSYIDERKAYRSWGFPQFLRMAAFQNSRKPNQGVERGRGYSLSEVREAIRAKSLSRVKTVACCSSAMAAIRVSTVVRLMPFERPSLKMLAASR